MAAKMMGKKRKGRGAKRIKLSSEHELAADVATSIQEKTKTPHPKSASDPSTHLKNCVFETDEEQEIRGEAPPHKIGGAIGTTTHNAVGGSSLVETEHKDAEKEEGVISTPTYNANQPLQDVLL
eukprot:CAMPEP_0185280184 /NCGR_PEP_ID=MMETSP1359-20130426/65493_1 /TAXON_ID=552665 /ORGANISM="Bigelowiella longifila, Strain CCMP242" /LENGTH=123 /DNA_ID=CAMNT_0027875337 /DNA_START=297 /DNA_END=668 /DNA_ORIENTATION=-